MNGQRENRIDLLRGLSLLLIFIGHAEFTFSLTFQHSRGFCDASEIFVLLAGMSSALAYYRPDAGLRLERPWKRALRLYLVHLLLFAIMLTISAVIIGAFDQTAWAAEMTDFWQDPFHHGFQALLLGYMPGNLDILPMYVVLLLIAPFAFLLHDWSRSAFMGLSCAVWFIAGLGHINLPNAALEGHSWYFDPLSWQFIFVIGIYLGVRMKRGQPVLPYNGAVFAAAALFAIAAIPLNLVVHLGVVDPPFGGLHHQLVSKTNGGPLRILNVLAILYLAWNIPAVKTAADHPAMRLVCVAGRHSLAVFSAGILLSFTAAVLMRHSPDMPLAVQLLLLAGGCALQLAIGWMLEVRKTARAGAQSYGMRRTA
ncbi:OpgC domain-containing protein [Pararhizobium sp. YC-54]|uniref:OpgC domain-containing protein n=1 Tax=Pararhizobium sp. YC-54 TaxID=2986920 RepID=UPI0021F7578A|nr:OpgC domain-containing protein [Pararhizobium sp. YC-54]MCW0000428.1 OpgC domain-containing protein [Pararhizobium sp. YC-54]